MAVEAGPGSTGRAVKWMGLVFAVLAVLMVPWTVYLAIELPERTVARHYAFSWAGFDVGLGLVLAWTAYCAIQRTRWLTIAASINAAMLVVDAWFDVLTSPTRADLMVAIATALFMELPLAGVCLWIAVNGRSITQGSVVLNVGSWRQKEDEPDAG